jgi:hypothetical protein
MPVALNITNSKLLAEETKQSLIALDDGSKYVLQVGFKTGMLRGLTGLQASTILSKFKQALGNFTDDTALAEVAVFIEKDQTEFNHRIIENTNQRMVKKLGLQSGGEKEEIPEEEKLPAAAKAGKAKGKRAAKGKKSSGKAGRTA